MDEDSGKKMRGRARGRGRGRARGRVRGRTKKPMKVIESDDEETSPLINTEETPMEIDKKLEQDDKKNITTQLPLSTTSTTTITTITTTPIATEFDLEADISQLEAPTFTTLNRGPPEPMLRLRWDHRVNLIGEKVLNPMIHCCDKCLKPILIYGRMIPCKHVFCLSCGKREDKVCPRCMDKVSRVEQTGLGTVFMCTHGGTRYGNAGCRRTYLSQRDLQAHINHRHILVPPTTLTTNQTDQTSLFTHTKTDIDTSIINKVTPGMMNPIRIKQIQSHMVSQQPQLGNDPRINSSTNQTSVDHRQQQQQQQQQQQHRPQQIMTMQNYTQNSSSTTSTTMRTNLITVPIQDNSINHDIHPQQQQQQQQQQSHHYYQQAQVGYGYSVPPPTVSQNQNYYSGQVGYPSQQQQQQQQQQQGQGQYVATSGNIRPSPNGYIQDGQYAQQQVPSQTQWNQHQQQQFYR